MVAHTLFDIFEKSTAETVLIFEFKNSENSKIVKIGL